MAANSTSIYSVVHESLFCFNGSWFQSFIGMVVPSRELCSIIPFPTMEDLCFVLFRLLELKTLFTMPTFSLSKQN